MSPRDQPCDLMPSVAPLWWRDAHLRSRGPEVSRRLFGVGAVTLLALAPRRSDRADAAPTLTSARTYSTTYSDTY